MGTNSILIFAAICFGAALIFGLIAGTLVGRHQLKKARGESRALLSVKERIAYLACVLAGVVCIVFGIFGNFTQPSPDPDPGINMGDPSINGENPSLEGNGENTPDRGGVIVDKGGVAVDTPSVMPRIAAGG